MFSARTIAKNIFSMLTGTALSRLFTLLAVAYAARVLQPDRFGQWSFAMTVASYFWMLVHLGLEAPAARYLTQRKGDIQQLIEWSLPLRFAGTLCGILAVALVAWLVPKPAETKWLVVLCYLPFAMAFWNLSWVYVWEDKVERYAAAQILEQGLNLVAVLALVHAPEHVARVPLAAAVGACGAGVLSWVWWWRAGRGYRLRLDVAGMWVLLKEGLQIVLSQAVLQLYLSCGILFLGFVSTYAEVALYSVGYRLATPFSLVRQSLIISFNPTFWRLYAGSRDQLVSLANRVIRYSACALFPATVCVTALSRPIVSLIFGPAYAGAEPALAALAWWVTLTFLNMSGEMILYAAARQGDVLKISVGSLVLALLCTVWFVPRWGATGAAAAMLVAELVWFPVRFRIMQRELPVPFWQNLLRPLLCALLMGAWLWWFRDGKLLLQVPLALVLYAAGLVLTRAVTGAELTELWRALRRSPPSA